MNMIHHRMAHRMGDAPGDVLSSERVLNVDFYTYSVQILALENSTSQTASIQIEADSDFEITKLTALAVQDVSEAVLASTQATPMVTVLLTDTGSGRNLMNIPVPITNIFGTAQLPFILPQPKLLFARSVLAITLANFSNAIDYSYISLSFEGRKIFRA